MEFIDFLITMQNANGETLAVQADVNSPYPLTLAPVDSTNEYQIWGLSNPGGTSLVLNQGVSIATAASGAYCDMVTGEQLTVVSFLSFLAWEFVSLGGDQYRIFYRGPIGNIHPNSDLSWNDWGANVAQGDMVCLNNDQNPNSAWTLTQVTSPSGNKIALDLSAAKISPEAALTLGIRS